MRLLVTRRRAVACVALGASYPLAFAAAWAVTARYLRRHGL
jgi:hypothetical protein